MTARAALALAWVAAALAGSTASARAATPEGPGAAEEPPCALALSPDDAGRVFRALRAVQDRDGCHLDAVETAGALSRLRWSLGSDALTATLQPLACLSAPPEAAAGLALGAFALSMPAAARARCPSAVAALRDLLASASSPAPTGGPPPTSPEQAPATAAPPTFHPVSAPAPVDPVARATVRYALPLAWLALAALGLCAFAAATRRTSPRDRALVASLTGLALALRLSLGHWGPGDLFDSVEAAYGGPEITDLGPYGRAPEALLGLLFRLFPADHDTFIVANLIAIALTVPALIGLARRLGWPRSTGCVAALLYAVAPLLVRFGPTFNRFSLAVLLLVAAFWAILAWLELRRAFLLVLAAIALALAPQCRPELLYLPAFGAALVPAWLLAGRRRLRRRDLLMLGAAAALLTALLLPQALAVLARLTSAEWSPHVVAELHGGRRLFDPAHDVFLNPIYTPLAWAALAVLGLLHRPGGSRGLLLWLVALTLALTAVVADAPVRDNLWDARYQLAAQPFWFLLAAAGLTGLLRGRGLLVAAALVAALALPHYPHVLRDTALDQQYRFLRQHLARVPDGCVILTFDPHGQDLGLRPSPTHSLVAGRHHRWRFDLDDPEVREASCLYFYLNAACFAVTEGHAANRARHCASVLDSPGVVPLAEARIDGVSSGAHRYSRERIPIGLYRLRGPPP